MTPMMRCQAGIVCSDFNVMSPRDYREKLLVATDRFPTTFSGGPQTGVGRLLSDAVYQCPTGA
jgi:hypothetical protein